MISRENIKKRKNIVQVKKNSELFRDELIVCNGDRNLLEMMIRGYKEMGDINLQLAMDNESELVDVIEYETWLCGV